MTDDPFMQGVIVATVAFACCLFICIALAVAEGKDNRQAQRVRARKRE